MEDKKNKDLPVIELRSEEVQELMDRKPSWILKYGISVVFLLLCSAFVGSKYIDYPDELELSVTLLPNVNTKRYVNKMDAEIIKVLPNLEKRVRAGDTLAVLTYGKDTVSFLSPYNGIAYFSDTYNSGEIVKSGDLSVLVSNSEGEKLSTFAQSYVDEEMSKKITIGMVMTTDNGRYRYVVKEKSSIPDADGLYAIQFVRVSKNNERLLIEQKVSGKVTIEKTNVYDKFFVQGIKNMIKI